MPSIVLKDATILDSASLSGEVNLEGRRPSAIIIPTGWDAASITFQASSDGGSNYYNVYDDTAEVELTSATASAWVGLNDNAVALLGAADRIKVRSGTSGAAVNQTGDITVQIVTVL